MHDILVAIERRLSPVALRFGLALAYDDVGEHPPEAQLRQLEYRPTAPGRPPRCLDVCQLPQLRTIVAELWSPGDLVGLEGEASVEAVAIRRRAWGYECGDESDDLVREVVGQITAWLERRCSN